jgi:hypothetical protein
MQSPALPTVICLSPVIPSIITFVPLRLPLRPSRGRMLKDSEADVPRSAGSRQESAEIDAPPKSSEQRGGSPRTVSSNNLLAKPSLWAHSAGRGSNGARTQRRATAENRDRAPPQHPHNLRQARDSSRQTQVRPPVSRRGAISTPRAMCPDRIRSEAPVAAYRPTPSTMRATAKAA